MLKVNMTQDQLLKINKFTNIRLKGDCVKASPCKVSRRNFRDISRVVVLNNQVFGRG